MPVRMSPINNSTSIFKSGLTTKSEVNDRSVCARLRPGRTSGIRLGLVTSEVSISVIHKSSTGDIRKRTLHVLIPRRSQMNKTDFRHVASGHRFSGCLPLSVVLCIYSGSFGNAPLDRCDGVRRFNWISGYKPFL